MTAHPKYMEQLQVLINQSLENGQDILELPNGEVVLTVTKTIIDRYRWNDEAQQIEKISHEEIINPDGDLLATQIKQTA